ncbi:unnamed protein product, partial [Mesorhabditis belari]|uniref:Galactosylgalactosylxylosylprotein 3-beta-glucuronosyltransferase n=1 Tax=Mesorhabditis belari TaxID=2138241 RepID=A0AAF3EYR4_9BILA
MRLFNSLVSAYQTIENDWDLSQTRIGPVCGRAHGARCAIGSQLKRLLYPCLFTFVICLLFILQNSSSTVQKTKEESTTIAATIENTPEEQLLTSTKAALDNNSVPLIIVITPTYKRITRLADITRLANTLRQVPHLHWIVVEDGETKSDLVEAVLKRSKIPYTYLVEKFKMPRTKGWSQRDKALGYLRKQSQDIIADGRKAVVYFGDDDNSYDLRLFDDYIRKVKKIGIWGVGTVADSYIESPKVENGKVIGWNVLYAPKRKFATDMAGFAIDLNFLKNSKITFSNCERGRIPEGCFLHGFGLTLDDLEPFGFDKKNPDLLVWHTRTRLFVNKNQDTYGYNVEKIE